MSFAIVSFVLTLSPPGLGGDSSLLPRSESSRTDASPLSPEPALFSSDVRLAEIGFPRPSIDRFLLDTGRSMLAPFDTEPKRLAFMGGLFVLGAVAMNYDVPLHAAISTIPNPDIGGTRLGGWISYLGEGYVDLLLVVAIGLIGGRDGERVAWAGAEALLAVAVVSRLGKLAFRLERPSADPTRHHWFAELTADAFPSGHVITGFATAAVLASQWPKLAPVFYGLASILAIARVMEHTHWPADCVVAAALGTVIGIDAFRLTSRFEVEVQPFVTQTGGGIGVGRRF